jgi:hypothetical protein
VQEERSARDDVEDSVNLAADALVTVVAVDKEKRVRGRAAFLPSRFSANSSVVPLVEFDAVDSEDESAALVPRMFNVCDLIRQIDRVDLNRNPEMESGFIEDSGGLPDVGFPIRRSSGDAGGRLRRSSTPAPEEGRDGPLRPGQSFPQRTARST